MERMMQADAEEARAYLKSEARAIEQGQVSEHLMRLQELTDMLHKDISILNERIHPVLKEDYPSPMSPPGDDIPSLVPLAEQIFNINEQLMRAHLRLSNIEERISL